MNLPPPFRDGWQLIAVKQNSYRVSSHNGTALLAKQSSHKNDSNHADWSIPRLSFSRYLAHQFVQ